MEITSRQAKALERIRGELADIGPCLPGSLVVRHGPCGKTACACQRDPARHHGPFRSWTRKLGGKTVTRLLSEDQQADYQVMFENTRRVREALRQLEEIGLDIVERDRRSTKP